MITFGKQDHAKEIKVRYLDIYSPSSYNMITVRPDFNRLGAALSKLYLCMTYLLPNGKVGFIKGYHEATRKCYS